jgi:hypothetical protein
MKLVHATAAIAAAVALASTAALSQEALEHNVPMTIDGVEVMCDGSSLNDRRDGDSRGYTLRIEVVGKGGQYLGSPTVTVKGNEHDVSLTCKGPWVVMKLPAGTYQVAADVPDAGQKDMTVRVPAGGQRTAMFVWPNAGGEITRPVGEQVAQAQP